MQLKEITTNWIKDNRVVNSCRHFFVKKSRISTVQQLTMSIEY